MNFSDIARLREIDLGEALAEHWRRLVAPALVLLLVGGAAGGAYWWFAVRWKPPPSIFDTPVDGVLGYLATPDFNLLPMHERMAYLQEFVGRMRSMSQQDSVVAAAFLAGVSGPVREQLTQNARVLAKDILIDGAATYVNLPPAERGAFIDRWIADWMRVAEQMATGKESNRTDEEIVRGASGEMRRNEEREAKRLADHPLTGRDAERFLGFWQAEVEPAASPREMGQISRFMDDMRTHLMRKGK